MLKELLAIHEATRDRWTVIDDADTKSKPLFKGTLRACQDWAKKHDEDGVFYDIIRDAEAVHEAASPAALAKEFEKIHQEEGKDWDSEQLDTKIGHFLIHKGLRSEKLERARDKIKDHLDRASKKKLSQKEVDALAAKG